MARYRPPDIEQYGEIGSVIPGSRLLRDYCVVCGEPIRVYLLGGNECKECAGVHYDVPPELLGDPSAHNNSNPWQENAIRALEDWGQ